MKLWKLIVLTLALVGIGFGGWKLTAPGEKAPEAKPGKVLRSRVIREAKSAAKRSARRIDVASRGREAPKGKIDENWNPFESEKGKFDMDLDFTLEGEVAVEMSKAVLDLIADMRSAQGKFDRKGVLAAVRKLLAMIAKGEPVTAYAKIQAIDALKFAGGGVFESLPELVQLTADPEPEVSEASLAAIQELLWDFDTTPQQIADAIAQLVKLTTDGMILNPFIFEMNGMPNSLKVSTSLTILDSGNKTAIDALGDNIPFLFDDETGKIQTRADIIQYGKDNPDSEQSDGFSATTGSANGK